MRLNFLTRTAMIAGAVMVAALPAMAQNIALIIGNQNYRSVGDVAGASRVLNTERALEDAGFDVVSVRDAGSRDMARAIDRFLRKIDDAERAVVVLTGQFANTGGETYFLPTNAVAPSVGSLAFDGVPLSMFGAFLAQKPGGAALFLGTREGNLRTGTSVGAGFGKIPAPQGVFAMTGGPRTIARAVRLSVSDGMTYAGLAREFGDRVQVGGFVSEVTGLTGGGSGGASQAELDEIYERGYFEAMLAMGTIEGMEKYLERYPRGTYAEQARKTIDDYEARDTARAEEAEAALRLNREQRRRIQSALSILGYDTRGIDGIFGRGTRAALRSWQSDNGLLVSGYINRTQLEILDEQAEERARQEEEEARRRQLEEEAADNAYWRDTGAGRTEEGINRYLRRYPDGLFADLAHQRLEQIERRKRDRVAGRERRAWDEAKTEDSIDAYEHYLEGYPQGSFADQARARIAELKEEADRASERAKYEAEEKSLNLNPAARLLAERTLQRLGFKPGAVDGKFTDETRRAIRRYQRSRGITVSGYITRQTAVRMLVEPR